MAQRKIILKTSLPPGDVCTLTAAIKSLHVTYRLDYLTDVRTSCDELFAHNPFITKLDASEAEILEMRYDLIGCCDSLPNAFIRGYCYDLGKKLGVPLELTTNHPHICLSEQERITPPLTQHGYNHTIKYWLLVAGVKRDYTLKQWPVEYYQEVVNHFAGRVQFVQVGSGEDDHPAIEGVINLIGKTSIRQLVSLAYHAQGGLGPITLLQHLCAAFQKPYVALLGGREPVMWTQYALQTTLHTLGRLPCCRTRSCWRARVVCLNDGSEHDASLCELPVIDMQRPVGKCMALIRPPEVIRSIETFYEGGAMKYADE